MASAEEEAIAMDADDGPGPWAFSFLAVVLVGLCTLVWYVLRVTEDSKRKEEALQVEKPGEERGTRRGVRDALRQRRRRQRQRDGEEDDEDDENEVGGGGDEEGEEDDPVAGGGRNARVARRRLARRMEREEERNEERAAREERARKMEAEADKGYDARRRKRDLEREEKEQEELQKKAEEEEKRRKEEDEEAAKWMSSFEICDGGSAQDEMEKESQSMLADFVRFIERKKVRACTQTAAYMTFYVYLRTKKCAIRHHSRLPPYDCIRVTRKKT